MFRLAAFCGLVALTVAAVALTKMSAPPAVDSHPDKDRAEDPTPRLSWHPGVSALLFHAKVCVN